MNIRPLNDLLVAPAAAPEAPDAPLAICVIPETIAEVHRFALGPKESSDGVLTHQPPNPLGRLIVFVLGTGVAFGAAYAYRHA